MLRKFWQEDSCDPLYDIEFAYALVNELLERDKTAALAFYDLYTKLSPKFRAIPAFMIAWGDSYLKRGNGAMAISLFQKALVLDSVSKEASAKLREAELLKEKQ